MPEKKKTHRVVKKPKISGRHLADYMAASETAQRTIIRNCKYQPIVRVVQHELAKVAASRFLADPTPDVDRLIKAAAGIRARLADSSFERDVLDHNADYLERFAEKYDASVLPDVERLPAGHWPNIDVNGVVVTAEGHLRLRRTTKTNKLRVGAVMLRYQKGKALPEKVAEWQSAFLFGYLNAVGTEDGADVERKLCLTLDVYTSNVIAAPSDSARRYSQMQSACETIEERWNNIKPPPNAVI